MKLAPVILITIMLLAFTNSVSAEIITCAGSGNFDDNAVVWCGENLPVAEDYTIYISYTVTARQYGSNWRMEMYTEGGCIDTTYIYNNDPLPVSRSKTYSHHGIGAKGRIYWHRTYHGGWLATTYKIVCVTGDNYVVSGAVDCISSVELFINNEGVLTSLDTDTTLSGNAYSFDINDGYQYSLLFSDGIYHNFTCTGNEVHNYNACALMTIHLKDYCGNSMTNTSADVYKSDGGSMSSYEFVGTFIRENPIELSVDEIGEGKMLDIYMDTDMGDYHTIDYCEEKSISILHPSKYWTMSYGAFDIDTKAPIEGMRVTMEQSCVIDPLHPLKQYLFTGANGYGTFIGLSGDKIDVMQGHPDYTGKAGYTNFFINIPADAFQTAYSIDTYFNKSDSHATDPNDPYDDRIDNITDDCSIWFEDSQGTKTNRIDDLDSYVDLYYVNNCTDTTLKFQSEEYGYWSALQSWSIPAGDSGYKRIYNSDFANANAYYRGYMYSDDMEDSTCDISLPLYVYNNMDEDIIDGCSIWYEDQTGKIDNHINDTDTYVDLYYRNSNCTSFLKFQRLYNTYWMTKQTFSIPANEIGYKRIYNTDFNDADANYRGYMYATSCPCDSTLSLYVTNQTIEENQHYENLTAHCSFKHQLGDGQVDFRSPVEILAYAYSNTSHTLLNINLTLYNKTTLIASKQCDWSDFAGASPKWFYVWSPNVDYSIGNNYTIIMTGYDGLKLDADTVWTSNRRNNKLTVNVVDNHNTPVAYSTVFVQGWGSQALDDQTSFVVTGLQNQVYQYKATKAGHTSSGWASVNLTDGDKTVSCVLVEQETASVTGYKLKEDEVKGFFIPLMYMLLIMILIGGLMNAAKN